MKRTLVVEYRNNEIIAFCNSERIFVRKADDADFDKFKEWIASYNIRDL